MVVKEYGLNMQITQFSDYAFRLLIFVAELPAGRLTTIQEVADSFHISRHHLVKVAQRLAALQMIQTTRGKAGGICLEPKALELTVREILEKTETNLNLVECFNRKENKCPIAGHCELQSILLKATRAFLTVLQEYTLSDLVQNRHSAARKQILKMVKSAAER